MDILKINVPEMYSPNLAVLPQGWEKVSFDFIDFSEKEELKLFLIKYLANFQINGADSLFLYPSELSYQIMVSLYREIASRVTADQYRFLNWLEFSAFIRSQYNKADQAIIQSIYGAPFVFVFDLTMSPLDVPIFTKLFEHCYMNKVKLFVCSRVDLDSIYTSMPLQTKALFKSKVLRVKING